jgi:hypothetical protein
MCINTTITPKKGPCENDEATNTRLPSSSSDHTHHSRHSNSSNTVRRTQNRVLVDLKGIGKQELTLPNNKKISCETLKGSTGNHIEETAEVGGIETEANSAAASSTCGTAKLLTKGHRTRARRNRRS